MAAGPPGGAPSPRPLDRHMAMMLRRSPLRTFAALGAGFALATPLGAQQPVTKDGGVPIARTDSVFARFAGTSGPGCAVGVSRAGQPVLARAYGMADLEHDVANTPVTVFEAGSVSKQLTAAATVLLALDGKLSLDDDVRKYIPELPDYGTPITIRHLLQHTSGLRDWGSVAAIGGWPRGTRTYTHAHVLDIARRQTALNYPPGTHYSYTNTGYNLQAILVERVSGMPFAEFSRTRLFEPLGLANTQWRDDYSEIVKGRAVAYRPAQGGGWRMDMPFENVHGNGGLLTTVDDLLRWTEELHTGATLGAKWKEEMHRQGRLNNGRQIEYASGLNVTDWRGLPEVSHSGATAGYRAFLARYPEQHVAVAVLCNAANANATQLAHQAVDAFLPARPATTAGARANGAGANGAAMGTTPVTLDSAALAVRAGVYRDDRMGGLQRLIVENGQLRVAGGPMLAPLSATRFQPAPGMLIEFRAAPVGGRAPFDLITPDGDTTRYTPMTPFTPTAAQLAEYAGRYRSEEADITYTMVVENGRLVMRDPVGNRVPLAPAYSDGFMAGSGSFRFVRDASGKVTRFVAGSDRVWALAFQRVE